MPNKDTVIAVISDMQVGGATALCPPRWQLKTHFANRVAALEDLNTIGNIYIDVNKSGSFMPYPDILEVMDQPITEF